MKKIHVFVIALIAILAVSCVGCSTVTESSSEPRPSICPDLQNEREIVSNNTKQIQRGEVTDFTRLGIEHAGNQYFVYVEKYNELDSYIFAVVTDDLNVQNAVSKMNFCAPYFYQMSFDDFKAGCIAVTERGLAYDNGYVNYHKEYKSRFFATAHPEVFAEVVIETL